MVKTNIKIKKGDLIKIVLDESGVMFLAIILGKASYKSVIQKDTFLPAWNVNVINKHRVWRVYDIENCEDMLVWDYEIKEILNEIG